MKKVIIEEFDGLFSIYDESGGAIEHDFETYEEAQEYAEDVGYYVVTNFFERD